MDDGWDDDLGDIDVDETETSTTFTSPTTSANPQQQYNNTSTTNSNDGGGVNAGGWEDDDELFADDDDDDANIMPSSNALATAATPAAAGATTPTNNDGWEDDDDLNLDDTWDENETTQPSEQQQQQQQQQTISGWGIEDDFGQNEEWGDDDNNEPTTQMIQPPPTNTSSFHHQHRTVPETDDEGDGWGDDEDLGLDDDNWGEDEQNNNLVQPPTAPPQPDQHPITNNHNNDDQDDGWNDDLDDLDDLEGFDDDDAGEDQQQQKQQQPYHSSQSSSSLQQKQSQIFDDLCRYVSSLSHILPSINAVLESEYNTPEKAYELVAYYQSRQNLAEYTRSKELPRMEYAIVLPYGHVETNKDTIAVEHLPDYSLISRCANQSLMADILQVITGPDLLVRPQYLAVCVAERCKFTIHKGEHGGGDMVDCRCLLNLSLPTVDGSRIDIGQLKVSIVFAPDQPMVEYKIVGADTLLAENDFQQLYRTVECLQMMEGHFDEVPGHEDDVHAQETPADIFRDAFIVKSSHVISHSTEGMKMAMQDMGSVVNLQSKFRFMKNMIPSNDAMLAAEHEAEMLAQQRQAEASHFQHSSAPTGDARPKSILGGAFRLGWKKLAQTVTLPDEDDAAIYGAPSDSTAHKLYRDEPPPSLYRHREPEQPTLYRKEESSPPNKFPRPPEPSPPTLYNRNEPEPPTLYRKDEPVQPSQTRLDPQKDQPTVHQKDHSSSEGAYRRDSSPVSLYRRDEPEPQFPTHYRKDPSSHQTRDTQEPAESFNAHGKQNMPQPSAASKGFVAAADRGGSQNQSYEEWLESQNSTNSGGHDTPHEDNRITSSQGQEVTHPSGDILDSGENTKNESYEDWLAKQSSSSPSNQLKEQPATSGDGWEEDDELLEDVAEVSATTQNNENAPQADTKSSYFIVDVPYDPETDIIQGRKRWINPRPNRPYLANINF